MSILDRFQNLFRKKEEVNTLDDSVVAADGMMPSILAGQSNRIQPIDSLNDAPVSEQDAETGELVEVPLLGRKTAAQHQKTLAVLLAIGLVTLGAATVVVLGQADKVGHQVAASGQALMQSQRLAKSVSQALVGNAISFDEVRDSSTVLAKTMRGLRQGDRELSLEPLAANFAPELDEIAPQVERAEKNATTVLGQQKILLQVGSALRTINRQSSDLLEIAETISSLKLQQNAPAAEVSASGQLVMLTQRIGKSANEFLTMEGVSPEAVFLLGKD